MKWALLLAVVGFLAMKAFAAPVVVHREKAAFSGGRDLMIVDRLYMSDGSVRWENARQN